jgi:hypothetical protein
MYCSLCHILLWTHCSTFFNFFHFDPQTFVLHDWILFGPNQRIIESNLLTKDKIKRWGIKVEKAPQIDDGFKVLVRNSL